MRPLTFQGAVFRSSALAGAPDTNPWDDLDCPQPKLTLKRAALLGFAASEVFTWAPFLLGLSANPTVGLALATRRQLQMGALSAAAGGVVGLATALGRRRCPPRSTP